MTGLGRQRYHYSLYQALMLNKFLLKDPFKISALVINQDTLLKIISVSFTIKFKQSKLCCHTIAH